MVKACRFLKDVILSLLPLCFHFVVNVLTFILSFFYTVEITELFRFLSEFSGFHMIFIRIIKMKAFTFSHVLISVAPFTQKTLEDSLNFSSWAALWTHFQTEFSSPTSLPGRFPSVKEKLRKISVPALRRSSRSVLLNLWLTCDVFYVFIWNIIPPENLKKKTFYHGNYCKSVCFPHLYSWV